MCDHFQSERQSDCELQTHINREQKKITKQLFGCFFLSNSDTNRIWWCFRFVLLFVFICWKLLLLFGKIAWLAVNSLIKFCNVYCFSLVFHFLSTGFLFFFFLILNTLCSNYFVMRIIYYFLFFELIITYTFQTLFYVQ